MKYKNLNGNSSVRSYTISYTTPPAPRKGRTPKPIPVALHVTFHGGQIYTYTAQSCGQSALNTMIQLAINGAGLNSYIKRNQVPYASRK